MRAKRRVSAYPSIEINDVDHQRTKEAQALKIVFKRYMSEHPGIDEENFAPR